MRLLLLSFLITVSAHAEPPAYRVLAQDKGHVALVNAQGEVEWEVACKFNSHDIAVLANGNFLLHTGPTTVTEMTRDKKVVWEFTDHVNFKTINQIQLLDVPGDVTKGEILR